MPDKAIPGHSGTGSTHFQITYLTPIHLAILTLRLIKPASTLRQNLSYPYLISHPNTATTIHHGFIQDGRPGQVFQDVTYVLGSSTTS